MSSSCREILLRLRVQQRERGGIQVELCLAGAYAAGEVDADVNNLALGGGVSLIPRDAHVPFSPPHALRHTLEKQFAYVRQAGFKVGLRRLWKLHWRGWKRVATIPWTHPAAEAKQGAEAAQGAAGAKSSAVSSTSKEQGRKSYKVPPWAVCPAVRLEMGV